MNEPADGLILPFGCEGSSLLHGRNHAVQRKRDLRGTERSTRLRRPNAMKRPRGVRINSHAVYLLGTGCIKFANGAVVELTVAEEELFELLLRMPKVTVPWQRAEYELARSNLTLRHLVRGLRDKLGSRSVKTHTGIGISLQPQFVGSARFALSRHPFTALPHTWERTESLLA